MNNYLDSWTLNWLTTIPSAVSDFRAIRRKGQGTVADLGYLFRGIVKCTPFLGNVVFIYQKCCKNGTSKKVSNVSGFISTNNQGQNMSPRKSALELSNREKKINKNFDEKTEKKTGSTVVVPRAATQTSFGQHSLSNIFDDPFFKQDRSKVFDDPFFKQDRSKVFDDPFFKQDRSKVFDDPFFKQDRSKVFDDPFFKQGFSNLFDDPFFKQNFSNVFDDPFFKQGLSNIFDDPFFKQGFSNVFVDSFKQDSTKNSKKTDTFSKKTNSFKDYSRSENKKTENEDIKQESTKNSKKTESSANDSESVCYLELGLKKGATKEEIQKAYTKLAMIYHPDRYIKMENETVKEYEERKVKAGEQFAKIYSAKEMLLKIVK